MEDARHRANCDAGDGPRPRVNARSCLRMVRRASDVRLKRVQRPTVPRRTQNPLSRVLLPGLVYEPLQETTAEPSAARPGPYTWGLRLAGIPGPCVRRCAES